MYDVLAVKSVALETLNVTLVPTGPLSGCLESTVTSPPAPLSDGELGPYAAVCAALFEANAMLLIC